MAKIILNCPSVAAIISNAQTVRWAFFALVLIGMIGYSLNRGVYFASGVFPAGNYFVKRCSYIFPNGVTTKINRQRDTWAEAKNDFCRTSSMTRPRKSPMKAKLHRWRISRIRGTPVEFIGYVEAETGSRRLSKPIRATPD